MDILDILLDILLKPPQPFIGLFLPLTDHFQVFFCELVADVGKDDLLNSLKNCVDELFRFY